MKIPQGWWYFTYLRVAHRSPALPILGLSVLLVLAYYILIKWLKNSMFDMDFVVPGFVVYILGYVIALLFYFRLGNSYYRWYDGLKSMTQLRANGVSFVIKVRSFLAAHPEEIRYLSTMMVNYYRSMRDVVRGIQNPENMIASDADLGNRLFGVYHLPVRLNTLIAERINLLYEGGQLTRVQFLELDRNINRNSEFLSSCEVLQGTPPPPSYIIHLRGFILFYAGIIPFGFLDELGIWMMLFLSVFFYFYAGMEIISEEVEDPFGFDPTDLPVSEMTIETQRRIQSIIKT